MMIEICLLQPKRAGVSEREYFWQAHTVVDVSDGAQEYRGRKVAQGKCLVEATYADGTADQKWVWLTKGAFRYSELDDGGNLLGKRRLADGQWRLDTDAMQNAIDVEEEAKRQCGGFDAEVELAEADGESDSEGDCVAESSDCESSGGDDM